MRSRWSVGRYSLSDSAYSRTRYSRLSPLVSMLVVPAKRATPWSSCTTNVPSSNCERNSCFFTGLRGRLRRSLGRAENLQIREKQNFRLRQCEPPTLLQRAGHDDHPSGFETWAEPVGEDGTNLGVRQNLCQPTGVTTGQNDDTTAAQLLPKLGGELLHPPEIGRRAAELESHAFRVPRADVQTPAAVSARRKIPSNPP